MSQYRSEGGGGPTATAPPPQGPHNTPTATDAPPGPQPPPATLRKTSASEVSDQPQQQHQQQQQESGGGAGSGASSEPPPSSVYAPPQSAGGQSGGPPPSQGDGPAQSEPPAPPVSHAPYPSFPPYAHAPPNPKDGEGPGPPLQAPPSTHGHGGGPPPGVHAFGPRQPMHPAFGYGQAQPNDKKQQLPAYPRFAPTGGPPTPTLNQLLQSNSPVAHRYPNSYPGHHASHPADQPHYGQWPSAPHPQRGGPTGMQQQYPPPPPPSGGQSQQAGHQYRGPPGQQALSPAYGGSSPGPGGYGGGGGPGGGGGGDSGAGSGGGGSGRPSWPPHGPASPQQQQQQQQQGPPTPQQQQQQQQQQHQLNSAASPQPPSHSPGPPGPGPGGPPRMPPSPQQHQGYPPVSRPPPPTTPNTHAPDAADLSGGNSNDSSGPNSQGMRPTPSPTGSTGSRSMSPAVGQNIPMPPRPSSGQSDPGAQVSGGGSGGGSAYKSHPGMVGQPPPQMQPSLYQQHQQHQQSSGQYGVKSDVYGAPGYPRGGSPYGYGPMGVGPGQQPPPTNSMPPQQQFPGRPQPNHMQNSQFPPSPYQQHQDNKWPSVSKGGPNGQTPPTQPQSPSGGPGLRPPHYLKHHLQHKMAGFGSGATGGSGGGAPPSPGPPQGYHMGPPSGAGPHHMGPPPAPHMQPPSSGPPAGMMPNNHGGPHPHPGSGDISSSGPMPPPSSTPNSHPMMGGPSMGGATGEMMDNGITTTAQGGMNTHVTATAGSVTSVVTTGPDGTPIDEGSQQSTLSNASAASGEDPQCPQTPKGAGSGGRKNDMGHYGGSASHPTTPQSTVPSPGAASMNSMHEDYELSSPGWPRTPASPVFNSHVPPQDTYRSKKTDSLSKLYEMDESPERKAWLDKLLAFMDDRRTPITTCPTISKNPLDLFRLYMYVKERGGFMEVTKNKTWKDIAGMLGIGASSSAAYTLRKHYTKNLLAYECQFDRGGIDPQPIINQVEASSKKKGAKATSVPSPGSSNSQDSFPPGGGGGSMDGYGGYNGYPSAGTPDYPSQRPPSQSAPSPHGGSNHFDGSAGAGGGGDNNVSVSNPFDDVSPGYRGVQGGPPQQAPPHAPYPGGPGSAQPQQQPRPQGYAGSGGGYQYGSGAQGYPPAVRPVYPPYSGEPTASANNAQGPPSSVAQDPYNRYPSNPAGYSPRPGYGAGQGQQPASQSGGYPGHQDYYRDQNAGVGGYPSSNKNMPPPGPQPPRRHPDFAKDQQQYPYGQPRQPMYGGWPNNNQYRPPQYQGARNSSPWPAGNQGYQGGQQSGGQPQWQPMASQGGQASPMRPVHRPGKPYPPIMPPGAQKGQPQPAVANSYGHGQLPKREITFPPDSVENVTPILYKRKRICKSDVGPVDAWRLIMCLRSGLLTESTYALDMLNILLFDDSCVGYFGLNQWPGLLDLLLEHFKRNLSDMFDGPYPRPEKEDEEEVDLGAVAKPIDPCLRSVILHKTSNYTLLSRKGDPVKLVDKNDDIFVQSNAREWDIRGEINTANTLAAINTDPWYTGAEHILPNFQAEFGRIPFHMKLKDKNPSNEKSEEKLDKVKSPPPDEAPPPESSDKKLSNRTKICDSSDDVITSRNSKDSTENNDALMLKVEKVKTEVVSENTNCEEVASSVDLNISVNGECSNTSSEMTRGKPIHDPAGSLKKRRLSDYEDEAYSRDEASLVLITESQDNVGKRSVCISNILRSLTFIPGNEAEFSKSTNFLALVGKILLLHHEHPPRTQKTRNYDREEDADFADSCSSLQGENEWWWDFLSQIRENILVCVANIAGQIDVSIYDEEVARPLLDGLLHWAICPSATAQDPFPSVGPTSLLSPQRLALEALCKLCVTNSNVDLVIATPPFSRLERLCAVLTKNLCRSEDQVLREFSINLLHYLAAADSSMARVVASQTPCVSLLVAFIEQAEQSALSVANQHGIGALRDNPDSMGTSLDMLRRAAATLVFLSRHPSNRPLLVQQEPRLLALVMSQILDQQVALLISKVLFQISRS